MRLIPLIALLFVGCSKSDSINIEETGDIDTQDTEETDTEETDTEEDCNAEVTSISPANNADGVPADVLVEAGFSEEASEASIALTGPNGVIPGTSSLADDGMSVSFTTDEDLARETEYVIEATVCDETTTAVFTTVPMPIDENSLVGRVYDLDLANVTWTDSSMSSMMGTLMGMIDTSHILMMVEAVDSTNQTIKFVGAPGWTDQGVITQYPCTEAIDFENADFSANPYFAVGPNSFSLDVAGYQIPVDQMMVDASFDADGSHLKNLHFQAYLDGSFVVPDFGLSLCDAASLFGVSCMECPEDSSRDCIEMDADATSVPYIENLVVNPDIDPSIDPNCN